MTCEDTQLRCADGTVLAASVYQPEQPRGDVVLIASALAVPRQFYTRLAEYLADNGLIVVTFDYRGINDSDPGSAEGLELADWGVQDIDAAIAFADGLAQGKEVYLIGHSIGGQLFALAERATRINKAVMVAASMPFWYRNPFPRSLLMWVFWYLALPVLSWRRELFPAQKTGLSSINLYSHFTRQWGRWGRDPLYFMGKQFGHDVSRYRSLEIPIVSMGFDDDNYAPKVAVDKMLSVFEKADIDARHVCAKKHGKGSLGHFGFFRDKCKDTLWPQLLADLKV